MQKFELLGLYRNGEQTNAVALPPGRLRLATKPSRIGSERLKTMGVVVVIALAASAEAGPPVATITATLR